MHPLNRTFVGAAFVLLFYSVPLLALDTLETRERKHSLELSPLSPAFRIYAIQYAYHPDPENVWMLGLSYADIPQKPPAEKEPAWMNILITANTITKDVGVNHSWTLFFGYKRYLFGNFHLEYQLWPGYNSFYSTTERKYYNGFDLWNEFRFGYTFVFEDSPLYINLQYLVGFGLIEGNKPADFGDGANPVFRAPVFFLGWKF